MKANKEIQDNMESIHVNNIYCVDSGTSAILNMMGKKPNKLFKTNGCGSAALMLQNVML